MGIFSDDFATVDFREDYANLSLPKEAKFKRCRTIKTNERKPCAAEKRQSVPKRVSGDGSAPPRLSVWFSVLFLFTFSWRVLGCGARQRGALVYAKHTLRCHFRKFTRFGGNIKYIDRLIQWLENYIRP